MTVPSFIKIKKMWWFYYSAQCTYLKQIYFFKVPGSMTSMVLQKDSTFFPLFVQACPSNTVCVFFLFWSLDYKKITETHECYRSGWTCNTMYAQLAWNRELKAVPRTEKCATLTKQFSKARHDFAATMSPNCNTRRHTRSSSSNSSCKNVRAQASAVAEVTQALLKISHGPCSNLCCLGSTVTVSALARSKLTWRAASYYTQATITPGCS